MKSCMAAPLHTESALILTWRGRRRKACPREVRESCYTARMPDQFTIYQQHADQYDAPHGARRLRSSACYPALSAIRSFDHADVVEWGAGTGRVSDLHRASRPIAHRLRSQRSTCCSRRRQTARASSRLQWQTVAADHRHMPLPDRVADVALAGWTLATSPGKSLTRRAGSSRSPQAIAQMQRVLRPGGTIIIIETLGTGCTEPHPPHECARRRITRLLENDLGFQADLGAHRLSI